MAKITDLAIVDAIDGTEFLPIVQRGATKRATMTALRALIVPFLQAWYKGDKGEPGAAGNVAATIAQLRAAPVAACTMIAAYDGSGATMTWTPGNHTGREDGITIIGSDHLGLAQGAWRRQPAETVYLRTFGADPTGTTSASPALAAALAAGRRVMGHPGDVYLFDKSVAVPSDRQIIGNGALMKLAGGALPAQPALRLQGNNCVVSGWIVIGNDGLYGVFNTGTGNEFSENLCTGNVGHFCFSANAERIKVVRNTVDGMTADREITTAFAFENCRQFSVNDNQFFNIPVGWAIQIRNGSCYFNANNNNCHQTRFSDTKVATADQRVFVFTLAHPCFLTKIQINGLPVSKGYTTARDGTAFTVTFEGGRTSGEAVKLIGYRGAENIQINTGSHHGTINGNAINGTADSGIVLHGSHLTVTGNVVENCGYAGIALYGGQNHVSITGNMVANCGQMDDAMSSPDDPTVKSVFAGAIIVGGENVTVTGNTFVNDSRTMRYAIRVNKHDMVLRTDGSAAITIGRNTFSGDYADGQVFIPQDTTGQRVNSVATDGPYVRYPFQIDLDQPWGNAPATPPYPPATAYIAVGGSGGTRCTRDLVTKTAGVASLRTVPGQYIDFDFLGAPLLFGTNVEVTFWAKSNGGENYAHLFTKLRGLRYPLTVRIMDEAWRMYTIRIPFTANLDPELLLRFEGKSESANVQHIQISGRRL